MPSAQDHVNVKPGGLGEAVLGNRLQVVEFPNMRHGWTTREDSHVTSAKLGDYLLPCAHKTESIPLYMRLS